MLSPQAELELLETDERLDALLERLEAGETLSAEEQSWVDAKLDRIDELMQKLGLSYDDDEEEEEEREARRHDASAAGQLTDCRRGPSRSADNPSGYMLSGVVIR